MTNTYVCPAFDRLGSAVPDAAPVESGDGGRVGAVTVSLVVSRATADRHLAGSVLAHVEHRPGIRMVTGFTACADVLLVLASPLTGEVLAEMTEAADRAENPHQRMVLVTGLVLPSQLTQVAAYGTVSLLPAYPSTPDRIVEVVVASAGAAARPVLPRHSPAATPEVDLTVREAEVLRLLADGHATNEIAERLHYSERTIKKDIHELMSRMSLRNRTHAVAHALRAGAI